MLLVLDFAFLTGELFVLSSVVHFCLIGRGGGVLLEPLELAREGAGHGSGLTLPDFAEEDLGSPMIVRLRAVHLLAVDHHHNIGVLLDASGISEVCKLGVMILALLNLAAQLDEEQDRFFLSESEYRLLKADDTYENYLGSGRKVRGGERSEGRIYESDSAMTESPQTLELWGVTDRDRAILIAVRALRRQVYITRNFSFSVDLSALNVQYLDYVGLFVPYSTAGVSGVIRDVAKTDSSYAYLNVKTNSGRSASYSDAYTQEADGTARKLTAVPQRNANPDTWKVTGADSVTADDAGMPIVCGKAIPCLVQSVTPGADKAKIELSEYSEEIYSKVKVYTRRGDTFDFSYYGDSSRTIA